MSAATAAKMALVTQCTVKLGAHELLDSCLMTSGRVQAHRRLNVEKDNPFKGIQSLKVINKAPKSILKQANKRKDTKRRDVVLSFHSHLKFCHGILNILMCFWSFCSTAEIKNQSFYFCFTNFRPCSGSKGTSGLG